MSIVLGVAEDGNSLLCEVLLRVARDVGVQAREDDVAFALELIRAAVLHDELAESFAHGQGLLPFHGVAVLLAGAFRGGADGGEGEVRVQGEEEDESLADGASRSQDTWGEEESVREKVGFVDDVDSLTASLLGKLARGRGEVLSFHDQ